MSARVAYIAQSNTLAGLLIQFYLCLFSFHHIHRVALLLSTVQSGYHKILMQKMKLLTFAQKPFMRFQADDLHDRCHGSESPLKSLKSSLSAPLLIIEACVKVLLIFSQHLSSFFKSLSLFSEIYFTSNVIASDII